MQIEQPTLVAARDRLAKLQSYLEHDPDNLNLFADVIDQALLVGDVDTAASCVQRALELAPGDAPFVLRQSSVAIAERNFSDALGLTEQLIAQGINEPSVRYNHAFALSSLGRFAEAREWLEGLYSESAEPPRMVVILLIRACHYLADMDRAIEIALHYALAYPGDAQVAGMLSLLYFDNDDVPAADVWAKKSLALGGRPDFDALLAAGGTALAQEDADAARGFMHRAVEIQPNNGRSWLGLGMADLLEGDLGAAKDHLIQAVRHMPEHLGSQVALGWVQLLQGNVDAAEQSFLAALSADPTFGESHGGLAAVAAVRGLWEKADEFVTIARRLDPDSAAAIYPQIVRLYREGKADQAAAMLEGILKRRTAPGGGSLLDMAQRTGLRSKK